MNVLCYQFFGLGQASPSKNNCSGCAISHLIVCSLANLYHHFGCWMLNVYLFENCSTVICYCYIAKVVYKHLVHSSWAKACAHNFCYCLCCSDVVSLRLVALCFRTALS